MVGELFDLDRLDDTNPFEINRQATHLFEHDPYGIEDMELRPLFNVAKPPAARLIAACCEPALWVANREVHDESDDVFAVTDRPIHCKFDQKRNDKLARPMARPSVEHVAVEESERVLASLRIVR